MLFRSGKNKEIVLTTHQLPMKNSFLEKHKRALYDVRLISHQENGIYYTLVSVKTQGQLERQEYLVKRAILDLKENYGWVVTAWE